MKKIISLLLSVIMIFSLVSVAASAADAELIITVANDLHYNHTAATSPKPVTKDYAHVTTAGQLRYENEIIIDAFLKEAAANESSVVLLPGDLVDSGLEQEYAAMSQKLAAFEKSSGKQVYVVPGNHALYDGALDSFIEYFADFGYNEAIARDEKSASYVAELPAGYRLIAIDSTDPGEGSNGMTEERAGWIIGQAEKAYKDGKKTIAMIHHNMTEHMAMAKLLLNDVVIEEKYGIQEAFTKYNVKYSFEGHTHEHDINTYTGTNGNTLYSVVTGALNSSPCPYRVVSFGDEVKFETRYITSVDMTPLKGVISENCYNLASTDFRAYIDECLFIGYSNVMNNYLRVSALGGLLKLDPEKDAEIYSVLEKIVPVIKEAAYMPIYTADEKIAGKSLQSVAKQFDFEFPESDHESFIDLALFIYNSHVQGDENFGLLSTEYVLATGAIAAFFGYILNDVSAEDYATVLNFVCNKLNIAIPVDFTKYAADEISKMEGIEILLSAGLSAILLQITTDDGTPDRNVTLPGYAAAPEKAPEEMTLWEKIADFFRSFFDAILRFFGVGRHN